MIKKFITLFIAIIALSYCKSKKTTATSKATNAKQIIDAPIIQMDTITVNANKAPDKKNYRNSNPISNDLIHTKLEVSFDWEHAYLNGKASIKLKPHFYPTNTLYLNARGMEIKSLEVFNLNYITVNKTIGKKIVPEMQENYTKINNASFVYEHDSLKINLGQTFTREQVYMVSISYISKPNELKEGGSAAISSDKGLYFINPKGEDKNKMPQIWTQGETQSNSVWFPTIDSPNQKTTEEIFMTVDNKYTTLSNGLLIESISNNNGTRTDHWKMDLPHAPYLFMMAVGEFKKVTDEPWNGKEVSYYVEKEYEPHAKAIFGDTKQMIDFFSKRLGVDYAWPKYAQIVVRDYVSGAMENTSATLHGDFAVYETTRDTIDGKKGNSIIAHELFHQWFGDLVTCESWSNLPLNESFATYGEYLWEEYKYGRDAADRHHYQSQQGYMAGDKEVNLIRFEYGDKEEMFDQFSYNKGGQVLHMLRKAVGDDAFFTSLKNYLETNKFKSAEIHDLRLAFERTTGLDLNWFFNQWFLNKGRPKLKISKNYNATSNEVELSVEQTQDFSKAPLYTLPIDIDIYVNGKATRTRILINEAKQNFKIKTTGVPQLVNFDAERQLLANIDFPKSKEEYLFQLTNAPLYLDKSEALKKLDKEINDPAVLSAVKDLAKNNPYFIMRRNCLNTLDQINDKSSLKPFLISAYSTDKKTTNKAIIIKTLNTQFGKDADVKELTNKALSEQSYAIKGAALEAIIKNDQKEGMEKAKQFENEESNTILFPIADLYASNGGDAQADFYKNNLKKMGGFETVTFLSYYSKCAKKFNNPANALSAANDFKSIAKSGSKFTKFGALKALKDLTAVWETKAKAAKPESADYKSTNDTKDALKQMLAELK
ncbi:MAG: M1 family metallopeptidase [Bacteroidetes bacterium]|nr:M1 family metallopeptidase [Bacteroidota bacterium]